MEKHWGFMLRMPRSWYKKVIAIPAIANRELSINQLLLDAVAAHLLAAYGVDLDE